MTDADALNLGRRAVACPGFRWMPGMLETQGSRMFGTDPTTGELAFADPAGEGGECRLVWPDHAMEELVPDFRDPAALGTLITLVRDAWGGHVICSDEHAPGPGPSVVIDTPDGNEHIFGGGESLESLAEALVDALEAAPGREDE